MRYFGEFHHILDSKGRFILPVEFRPESVQPFWLTVGLENCVAVYPTERWNKMLESWEDIPWEDQDNRAFFREVYAKAKKQEPDRQGRMTIPPVLRGYADIEKDIVITGAGDHLEIWSKKNWEEYETKAKHSLVQHASKLTSYNKQSKDR
jgi:MraZ protein